MSENSKRKVPVTATDSVPRPGDFALGSVRSRAAARALVEKRRGPNRPPAFRLDLSSSSIEHCQEIYEQIVAHRHGRDPIPDCMPKGIIIFPPGFTPRSQAPEAGEQAISRSEDILRDEDHRLDRWSGSAGSEPELR